MTIREKRPMTAVSDGGAFSPLDLEEFAVDV
jgi:hypothetical protein